MINKDYSLINEMFETVNIISEFDESKTKNIAKRILEKKHIMLTGEGSSRIFPSKNFIYKAMTIGLDMPIITDGSYQASEYDLSKYAVLIASNSGKTKEAVSLIKKLQGEGHDCIFGVTANDKTPIADLPNESIVLGCGSENAVAATKSVVEQALVYHSILANMIGCDCFSKKKEAAAYCEKILSENYSEEIIEKVANARTICFAGRNDGVAEELTLKTNEITRKRSDFYEGTYALHGVEEVMSADDVVVFIEPFESEFEKMNDVFIKGVGASIVAISSKDTPFPTIKLPTLKGFDNYFRLLAGWNLLVQVGLKLGVDLDHPVRARKIGNAM